ncbi:hypothetical protein KAZ66_00620 [Candidatus Woesebacteria bacterium]|nr:hypothetical protein [Candidatus Woesebacteria bacterium]
MQGSTETKEQSFWDWFSAKSDKLFFFELYQEKLLPETLHQIQQIHPDLVFEISPELDGKRDFIISANGLKEAFPAVIDLVRSAPQFDSWNIIPFRQRKKDLDMEVEIEDVILSPDEILFDYDYDDNKVNLDVYVEDVDSEDSRVYHIVFILLDNIIGEYDVEMKIGRIDIYTLDETKSVSHLHPLSDLPRIVDNLGKKTVH